MAEEKTTISTPPAGDSILDRIMGSQTQSSLNEFEPVGLVETLLNHLKQRDREILALRFGLLGMEIETLEAIGKRYALTRERVRQIEKDSLNTLRELSLPEKNQALQLIFDTIREHGSVMSQEFLLQSVLVDRKNVAELQALKFLLNIDDQLIELKETPNFYQSWSIMGFDLKRLEAVVEKLVAILEEIGHVIPQEQLSAKFRTTPFFAEHGADLSDRLLQSYLNISKAIQINPFNEIGLKHWSEVKPRDVGDKAYLVLKHFGKPEHYSAITKMINEQKFDGRTAFQETVHNELIKDNRFVLVGRGIYALSEWGFKSGVVADVIKEIITTAGKPLTRDEIINEVMKKRQVKRNTILVGLSNRKNFVKVGKDRYGLAVPETSPEI
jgi:hypothetical protein